MTEAEELHWLRDWRNRLLAAMRLWWKPSNYPQACARWTDVKSILAETPEAPSAFEHEMKEKTR